MRKKGELKHVFYRAEYYYFFFWLFKEKLKGIKGYLCVK